MRHRLAVILILVSSYPALADAAEGEKPVRKDLYGDPLQEGAIARTLARRFGDLLAMGKPRRLKRSNSRPMAEYWPPAVTKAGGRLAKFFSDRSFFGTWPQGSSGSEKTRHYLTI